MEQQNSSKEIRTFFYFTFFLTDYIFLILLFDILIKSDFVTYIYVFIQTFIESWIPILKNYEENWIQYSKFKKLLSKTSKTTVLRHLLHFVSRYTAGLDLHTFRAHSVFVGR